MTANEGYNLIKDKVGTRKIIACVEYKDYFLYSTVPENYKMVTDSGRANIPFDSSYLIDKNTGEMSVFNPIVQDIGDEYKIIEDFR